MFSFIEHYFDPRGSFGQFPSSLRNEKISSGVRFPKNIGDVGCLLKQKVSLTCYSGMYLSTNRGLTFSYSGHLSIFSSSHISSWETYKIKKIEIIKTFISKTGEETCYGILFNICFWTNQFPSSFENALLVPGCDFPNI
jgi:hypothetical protein